MNDHPRQELIATVCERRRPLLPGEFLQLRLQHPQQLIDVGWKHPVRMRVIGYRDIFGFHLQGQLGEVRQHDGHRVQHLEDRCADFGLPDAVKSQDPPRRVVQPVFSRVPCIAWCG